MVSADVAAAYEAEYNRWLSDEIVPSRVALDGVIGVRRWVREDLGPPPAHGGTLGRYLLMYELEDVTIPQQAPWKALAGTSERARLLLPHIQATHGSFQEIV